MEEESIYHPYRMSSWLRIVYRTFDMTTEGPCSYIITKAIVLGPLY